MKRWREGSWSHQRMRTYAGVATAVASGDCRGRVCTTAQALCSGGGQMASPLLTSATILACIEVSACARTVETTSTRSLARLGSLSSATSASFSAAEAK